MSELAKGNGHARPTDNQNHHQDYQDDDCIDCKANDVEVDGGATGIHCRGITAIQQCRIVAVSSQDHELLLLPGRKSVITMEPLHKTSVIIYHFRDCH